MDNTTLLIIVGIGFILLNCSNNKCKHKYKKDVLNNYNANGIDNYNEIYNTSLYKEKLNNNVFPKIKKNVINKTILATPIK